VTGMRVAVVGAGTVGLSVAWTLSGLGHRVTVFDPEPGSGASWVAGGMIAPFSEAWPGEEALLHLGVRSLGLWPGFAAGLARHADGDLITARGTVWLGMDDGDADDLRTMAAAVRAGGYRPEEFAAERGPAVRARVPGAGHSRAAAWVPGEIAVDNRKLYRALLAACTAGGVELVPERVGDLAAVPADQVVLCTGHAADELVPGAGVYPVKGEVVRLRRGPLCLPPPTVTVRAKVNGRPVYIVPRADGVVIGATQYENDRDLAPRIGPVVQLLQDAFSVLPHLQEYELDEVRAGLRPGTKDNLPVIARRGERTVVAAGHGRNGILLSPVTAVRVAALVTGETVDEKGDGPWS
jgi:glycine oxidase